MNPATHFCFTSLFYYQHLNGVWYRIIHDETLAVSSDVLDQDLPAMVPIEHWPPPEGATHFDCSPDEKSPWLKIGGTTVNFFNSSRGAFEFLGYCPSGFQKTWTPLPGRRSPLPEDSNYDSLRSVLDAAFDQAANGKGKERHANGLPFSEQRMQQISRALQSERGMAFQAIKKLTEGLDLETYEARRKELLGAIVYIAGILVYWEKRE